MAVLKVLTFSTTFSNNAMVNAPAVVGDSGIIENFPNGAFLISAWADFQGTAASNILRITGPPMTDQTQGARYRVPPSEVYPLMPPPFRHPLRAQDQLLVGMQAADAAGDIENASLLLYAPTFPGNDMRFIDPARLDIFGEKTATVEVAVTAGTAGGYSGTAALNATFDLLPSGVDFAVVGIETNVEVCTVCLRGPDLGGQRTGVPGHEVNKSVNSQFFFDLSRELGLPLIPVINWANRASTFVEVVNDENAASPVITLNLVQLRPNAVPPGTLQRR